MQKWNYVARKEGRSKWVFTHALKVARRHSNHARTNVETRTRRAFLLALFVPNSRFSCSPIECSCRPNWSIFCTAAGIPPHSCLRDTGGSTSVTRKHIMWTQRETWQCNKYVPWNIVTGAYTQVQTFWFRHAHIQVYVYHSTGNCFYKKYIFSTNLLV